MKIRPNPIFPTNSIVALARELGVLWRELADNVLSAWRLPVYTMDTLPTNQNVGDIAYATDGYNHDGQGYNENGAFVVSDGTNWVTPYHRHYRTTGVNLDIPSIAAGAVYTTSFSTSGTIDTGYGWVSENNMVSVGPPKSINAGLIWSAYVSAEDEITLRVYNTTGSAINPTTDNWMFAVFPQV